MTDPTYDEISERARKLWQERGQPAGQDNDIWFQAERELRSRSDAASQSNPARTAAANTETKPSARENGRERNRATSAPAPRSMSRATQGRSQMS